MWPLPQAFAIKVDVSQFESSSAEALELVLCAVVLIPIIFTVLTAIVVTVMPILEA